MPYKTILVHLNNEQRVARLIRAAMQLALPSNSHVTGLFVVPPAPATSALLSTITGGAIQGAIDSYRQSSHGIRSAFEGAATGQPIVAEYRLHEAKRPGYIEAVLTNARSADLVVSAQKENDWDYADMFDIPDWLSMESGRPVLVVPRSGDLNSIGERVLVAWNNSREATRAVFDALPVLVRAKEVIILVVEEADKPETKEDLAGIDICATLARHGVKCTAHHVKPNARDTGSELLAQVAAHDCDVLVMGCYGRSRFREFVLGGASRHILQHAKVPVLMAH